MRRIVVNYLLIVLLALSYSCTCQTKKNGGNPVELKNSMDSPNHYLCTEDMLEDSLEEAIKQYVLFSWHGEMTAYIMETYPPALDLLWGNKSFRTLADGTLDSYSENQESFIKDCLAERSESELADNSNYVVSVTHVMGSQKTDAVEFRVYQVVTNITPKNGTDLQFNLLFYDHVVCVKKNNSWRFYMTDIEDSGRYMIDRKTILLDYMQKEGYNQNEISNMSNQLAMWSKGSNSPYINIENSPLDEEIARMLKLWKRGCLVLCGKQSGYPLNYIYREGWKNIDETITDDQILNIINDNHKNIPSDLQIVPYDVQFIKGVEQGPQLYLIKSVWVSSPNGDHDVIMVSKDIVVYYPNKYRLQIVDANYDKPIPYIHKQLRDLLSIEELTPFLISS